jgi:hypothetical protein
MQLITNNISSTKIRAFLHSDLSIRYVHSLCICIPRLIFLCDRYLVSEPVIQYIEDQGLYRQENGAPDPTPTLASAPANAKAMTADG